MPVALAVPLVPSIFAVGEIVVGTGLMLLGLLWLLSWTLWPRHHPFAGGVIVGGLVGWQIGRRPRTAGRTERH